MDFVPDESAIKTDLIEVDKETIEMLNALGMGDLPGVVEASVEPQAFTICSLLVGWWFAKC
ncbi:hypothetical protein Lser_V15G08280 [Lactuca serriola]